MTEARLSYLGESSDGRTNRWRVYPSCGHKPFEPGTTRLAHQIVQCPRCLEEWFADYNNQTIRPIGKEVSK